MTDGYGVRLQIELGGRVASPDEERDHTEWDSGVPVRPMQT
jgi:hypothetical protein